MNLKDKLLIFCAKIKNNLRKYRTKKIDNIEYYFDEIVNANNVLYIRGWILSRSGTDICPSIVFKTKEDEKVFGLSLYDREDVVEFYNIEKVKCGFNFEAIYKSNTSGRIYLQYTINSQKRNILLGAIVGNKFCSRLDVSRVVPGAENYTKVKSSILAANNAIPNEIYNYGVDIIVPVYNGFEYLERLFNTIEKTKMNYKILIINDKSTDERVLPFLVNYAKDKENVFLIENKENLGFVKSVNKAMLASERDVVIVNTDVILPDMWLERIMLPIIFNNDVASSTPFTNSGTICSFPNFCENNDIFLNLDVDDIDNEFKNIKPVYNEMPTGVGFCMGMKRDIISKIGLFDAETFYKGYGEENDWCQRAIKNGYRNVMVENLFVWHKHGGSFLSEDKKRYIERNLKLLNEKHTTYDADVQLYCKMDPVKCIREYVKLRLMLKNAEESYIVFDHNWGGGASTYIRDRIKEYSEAGKGVFKIIGEQEKIIIEYYYKEHQSSFYFENIDEIFDLIKDIKVSKIIINEMVSFENIFAVQKFALKLKKHFKAQITMLGHDFFAVCPSLYLMDNEDKHCFTPDIKKCESCFKANKNKFENKCSSIYSWRENWNNFLTKCDRIILFSNNTKHYFDYWYKNLNNIEVIPHKVDYIKPVGSYKHGDIVTIAIIGNLMKTKGSDIIYEMSNLIKNKNLKARIVVIGPDIDGCTDDSIIIHGKYKREELPELIEKYKADVIFIASIWPETFSYTTQEAINMNVPVAAFNLGAPAERLSKYDKSIIINNIDANEALEKIMEYAVKK